MEKKPNIFICGASGTGKSTSMRNLDPKTTVILNTERKQLPFRGALKFDKNVFIETVNAYQKAFEAAMKNDEIEVIIIESFTSLHELIYKEAENGGLKGFDIWKHYKSKIREFLDMSKNTNKWIIFIGIDMLFEGSEGIEEKCIQVDGSLKKTIEKEFVIVCYTANRTDDEGNEVYEFLTNKQSGYENINAKSPMDMLPKKMPNDLAELIKQVETYYTGE